jgi:hypothetical protein
MSYWASGTLLFVLLVITIASASVPGSTWIAWLTILIMASAVVLSEAVFSGKFLFDPFYANYEKANNPRY